MDELICSAKGCRAPATWRLLWNNPKLHTPERRKTWLACDNHRESLSTFLDARGFLRETTPIHDQDAINEADRLEE
ncbi:acetone carboxylase [Dactylosporangium sp. CA-233914]|uniref:acetone carboxylase n=1 Tax=Dactylosporangium sp. CA-233914 TaxID=3239934 RepID=UPI003D93C065